MRFNWHPKAKIITAGGEANFNDLRLHQKCHHQESCSLSTIHSVNACSSTPNTLLELFSALDFSPHFRIASKQFNQLQTPHCDSSQIAPHVTDQPCFVVPSGGTSGYPKQILRTHQSWIKSFTINTQLWPIAADEKYGLLGDITHSITLFGALEGIHLGKEVYLLKPYRPKTQLEIIQRAGITLLYATPVQLGLLTRVFDSSHLSPITSVKRIIVGGSNLSSLMREQLLNVFPEALIIAFFGSTEASFVACTSEATPEGSVGTAYPEVRIDCVETNDVPATVGKTGRIRVHSPFVGLGTVTELGFKPFKGVCFTGEIGFFDQQSNLYISGRSDRMFTTSDVNIFPEEIETYFLQIPNIVGAYVYPLANSIRGQSIEAFLFVGKNRIDVSQILKQCRQELGSHKTPKTVHVMNGSPPLLPSGKPNLNKIRALIGRNTP